MKFTTGDLVLIDLTIGTWLVGAILALINLFLIAATGTPKFMAANFGAFLLYIAAAVALFGGAFGVLSNDSFLPIILIYGIPLLAILHFCFLIWARRRSKRKEVKNDT